MKTYLMILVLSLGLFSLSHADTVVAIPTVTISAETVPLPTPAVENSVITALKAVDAKIPLGLPGWTLLVVTLITELLMRFVPTAQPRSLLILLALGLNLLGSILTKVSGLVDKVAQNVKADKK